MITVNNTVAGAIKDIEIKGNTIQSSTNLSDIKSVGDLQPDGTFKMSILSCGKNLFDGELQKGGRTSGTGALNVSLKDTYVTSVNFTKVDSSFNFSSTPNHWSLTYFCFDKDKQYLGYVAGGENIKLKDGTVYIHIHMEGTDINANVQIEVSSKRTPYVPHESNKSSILLPCQLEKVGTVADRLYYDSVEGAWCVEKYIMTKALSSNCTWGKRSDVPSINTSAFIEQTNQTTTIGEVLSDKFQYITDYTIDTQAIRVAGASGIQIRILNSSLSTQDSAGCKKWIDDNKPIVKYQLSTPQKIVLPKTTQIQLNSFLEKTHIYTTDTVIEPTIKAKVSKSLGASVESLGVKTDILECRLSDVEGLKSSQDMRYQTDKGYLVCNETMDGVVKDIKIKGKTLVNLSNVKKGEFEFKTVNPSNGFNVIPIRSLEAKDYYFNMDIIEHSLDKGIKCSIEYKDGVREYPTAIPIGTKGRLIYKVSPKKEVVSFRFYTDNTTVGKVVIDNIMLLDDNYEINEYIDGLQSVGENVDKIEVSSYDMLPNNKENKFGSINSSSGQEEAIGIANCIISGFNHISSYNTYVKLMDKNNNVLSGTTNYNNVSRRFYDKTYNYIGTELTDNAMFVRYRCLTINNYIIPGSANDYMFKDTRFEYIEGVQDKKAILYQDKETNEWLPMGKNMPLHEWDIIDEVEGKLYKRSGKREYQEGDETNPNCITDMTNTVYKLTQEEVYDISPINVDAYANKTMISLGCGAINPNMEFSITSYITNIVQANKERIKALEGEVYKYMIAQNRMQLSSMYSADSVTFKVDYASLLSDEKSVEEYNEDKYNLILNNILVGKDNYNYDKMFSIILDYATWEQISWEQFDILVGLMDYQENPPVEEVPEEAPEI